MSEVMTESKEDLDEWKPPYSVTSISKESGRGSWNVQDVSVIGPGGEVVGTYTYNYHQTPPFCPFRIGEQWYALYSKRYTASRVMKLPSCEDVWGEDSSAGGFCPVEFFVPAIQEIDFDGERTGKLCGTFNDDFEDFGKPGKHPRHNWLIHEPEYLRYGFVCGCVWGDDSSWKVQFFDFSDIENGNVTYDARLGYVELIEGMSLQKSIKSPRKSSFELATTVRFKTDGSQDNA